MNLYEMSEQYNHLLSLMEESEIDAEVLADTLEGLEGDIDTKIENIGKVLKILDYQADILKQETDRLSKRRKSIENNHCRLKEKTKDIMLKLNKKKVQGTFLTVSVGNNPKKIVVTDEELFACTVPQEFVKVETIKKETTDYKAVLQALESGREIKGCEIVQEQSLRVR